MKLKESFNFSSEYEMLTFFALSSRRAATNENNKFMGAKHGNN